MTSRPVSLARERPKARFKLTSAKRWLRGTTTSLRTKVNRVIAIERAREALIIRFVVMPRLLRAVSSLFAERRVNTNSEAISVPIGTEKANQRGMLNNST